MRRGENNKMLGATLNAGVVGRLEAITKKGKRGSVEERRTLRVAEGMMGWWRRMRREM